MPTFVYGSGTITKAEFEAATSSIWFNPFLMADGRGNLTPEANIAVLRGARYDSNGPLFPRDMFITDKAMRDLATYLGFANVNDYNSALLTERSKIFDRVPAPPAIPATSTYPYPVIVAHGETEQLSDKPTGVSTGTIGPPSHGEPSLFDTGYYYNGQLTPGAATDFGNSGRYLGQGNNSGI